MTFSLLNRLQISQKLAILVAALVSASVVSTAIVVGDRNEVINFSSAERIGAAYIVPVQTLAMQIAKHRGLSSALLSGDATANEALKAVQSEIQSSLGKIEEMQKSTSDSLKTDEALTTLINNWKKLQADYRNLDKAASFERHTTVVANATALLGVAVDNSNLSLDPDIDSYYTMDIVTSRLPAIVEALGQARGRSIEAASSKMVSADLRNEIVEQLARAKVGIEGLVASVDKVANSSPALKNQIGASSEKGIQAAKRAEESIEKMIIRANTISVTPKEVFDRVTPGINGAFELYGTFNPLLDELLTKRVAKLERARNATVAMVALLVLLAVGLAVMVSLRLVRQIGKARQVAAAIQSGDLSSAIEVTSADETGQLLGSLAAMQKDLHERIERDAQVAAENLRVKQALDCVSANVMLANAEGEIIYLNGSLAAMLQANEAELRKVLPQFDARNLIGASMDVFHKNPGHQRAMVAKLQGSYKTEFKVSALTLGLIATPIINAAGERVGTAVEWKDRTQEVLIEQEVAEIVSSAANGDFHRRVALEGKEGFSRQLAENLNKLLDTSSGGLEEVSRVLGALASGNLTDRIDTEYSGTFGKLKEDSNATVQNLTEIVGRIKSAAETINVGSGEIAAGNQDLSQRTEEQASSLQETASSMEELTQTVKQNAENSKQANQLAIGASEVAVKGGEMVNKVVHTMASIQDSSKKIVDIISVIDGIAFQTNILALNAAVEAARAGEQGRGFAVVASEVRNLAQRSAAAAKEIKTLIGDSVEKVGVGTKLVESAGQTMDDIVLSVKRVSDIIAEITAASLEQASGIEQVGQAISQMDQVTQQNAALVEQAAAAAESMREQAGALTQAVSVFVVAEPPASLSDQAFAAAPRVTSPRKPLPNRKEAGMPAARKALAPAQSSQDEWEEF